MLVHIVSNNVTSPDFPVTVIAADPEVFRNADGTAAALNQDGTLNSASHPAKAGSIVSIWATGTGSIYPRPLDGQILTAAQDYQCCQVASAPVFYAGAAPGMVAGVVQINFQTPNIVSPVVVEFAVLADGQSSATAAIYVTP
jgi:uncharacterized protein (TIGR03437 family)